MGIIATKQLHTLPGSWFVDADDYFAFTSKNQLSSLFPKRSPFITSGYWDDIALTAILPDEDNQNILILGAGIGSFLPLVTSLKPTIPIRCIESNSEILEIGKKLTTVYLEDSKFNSIQWFLMSADKLGDDFLSSSSAIFIDLYHPLGIHELAYDPNFHQRLQNKLNPNSLVFINIYDQVWETTDTSPTTRIMSSLKQIYSSFITLRRPASTTLICSLQNDSSHLMDKVLTQLKLHSNIWPQDCFKISDQSNSLVPSSIQEKLDKEINFYQFSDQLKFTGKQTPIGNGLVEYALKEMSHISPLDMVKYSRKRSDIL